MSVWSRILKGAADLSLNTPIGDLLGALTGGGGRAEPGREGTHQVAFTIAVIALGAKMAKADGVVTEDEVEAFKEVFHVPPEEMKNVGRVFNMARKDAAGYEAYARQVARMFRGNPVVLEDLLHGLFHIAKADGVVHLNEVAFLQEVGTIFGFDEFAFNRIRAHHLPPEATDPYVLLGMPHDAADGEVRTAYRALVRENHPDRLMAQGLPEEFVKLGTEKLAQINDAYQRIRQQRGLT